MVVLDYEAHEDRRCASKQADLWLGFEPRELKRMAKAAGLVDTHWQRLPAAWQGEGPDRHLGWQLSSVFAVSEAVTMHEDERTES